MSSMKFTCDSCGREVFGYTFVKGMKFCAKCYQETFEETEKDRKISDLETKLAEKDKAIENWQTMYESVVQTCHNDKEEIERLNKQLAEKEKEIEKLKSENHALMSDNAYQEADIFELNSFKEYYKNNKI